MITDKVKQLIAERGREYAAEADAIRQRLHRERAEQERTDKLYGAHRSAAFGAADAVFEWIQLSTDARELFVAMRASRLERLPVTDFAAFLLTPDNVCGIELCAFAKQWSRRIVVENAHDFRKKTGDGMTGFDGPMIELQRLVGDDLALAEAVRIRLSAPVPVILTP